MSGTRTQISSDVLSGKYIVGRDEGLMICLESSVSDNEMGVAEF
jgi:hypothetical protein